MRKLGRLTTALIECRDIASTGRFYSEKLGLPVTAQGDDWMVFDCGGQSIVLWQGDKAEVVAGFTGADLEGARAELIGRGAEPTPVGSHPGGQHFYVADPEGNRLCFNDR